MLGLEMWKTRVEVVGWVDVAEGLCIQPAGSKVVSVEFVELLMVVLNVAPTVLMRLARLVVVVSVEAVVVVALVVGFVSAVVVGDRFVLQVVGACEYPPW